MSPFAFAAAEQDGIISAPGHTCPRLFPIQRVLPVLRR